MQRDQVFNKMSSEWQKSMADLVSQWQMLDQDNQEHFAEWDLLHGEQWLVSETIPEASRIDNFEFSLAAFPDGIPEDEHLHMSQTKFALPMTLLFKESSFLLLRAKGVGHDAAVATLQTAMLRMMTLVPRVNFDLP